MPLIRILSWNILQGGGRRRAEILERVAYHHPDVLALQEYRSSAGNNSFEESLFEIGLPHFFVPPSPSASTNLPALASRWPFDVIDVFPGDAEDQARCFHVRFEAPDAKVDLNVVVLHLPHKKEQIPVFHYLANLPVELRATPALLIGDFNCGVPHRDSETRSFSNTRHFQQLIRDGWVDAWRTRHPDAREFTWISPGKKNGYRYDNALVSRPMNAMIEKIAYDHEARETRASDHSALYLDVRFPESDF